MGGGTTTARQEVEFSPEQLAAMRLGAQELAAVQPLETMQIQRALGLLQPPTAEGLPPGARAIGVPISAAAETARTGIARGLAERGLPGAVTAPLLQDLAGVDRETMRNIVQQIVTRYLTTPSLQLYDPRLGRVFLEPESVRQVSRAQPGTGAQVAQGLGMAAGVAVAAAAII